MPGPTRDFAATTFVVWQRRTLLLWHRKSQAWLPPGGHIEPSETPDEAAVREVAEETGLRVELLGATQTWGPVTVLRPPVCVLLETIRPDHQHVDLIYFARALDDQVRIDPQEATAARWFDAEALAAPQIAADIRILGLRAIAAADVS